MRKASRLQALALAADGGGVAWTTSLMRRMHSVSAPALGACAASPTLQHAHQQTDGGPSWRSKFAAAAVGLAAALASGSLVVHGDASRAAPTSTGPTTGEQLAQLHEWLAAQGADVSRVQVRASQAGPGAGLGLYSAVSACGPKNGASWWSWLWPRANGHRSSGHTGGGGAASASSKGVTAGAAAAAASHTLATFPLSSAITVRTACSDPVLGQQFSWMLEKQLLDERSAVMVFLLLERLRAEAGQATSRWAPWIRCLPSSIDTPLAYSDAELSELRGTALHRATAALGRRVRDTWARLEAPLAGLARDLGLRRPTMEDWVWAYGVFWSRGQSLPVPQSGSASQALARHSSGRGESVPITILEGLVPGLDFANHRVSPGPQCWWEVVVPERQQPAEGSSPAASAPGPGTEVRLQLHGGASVTRGSELFISYGDKSNEELLMLHGFALPANPHDRLMLHCPLPPQAEWDDVMYARMELLQAYGLRPQFFLPHPDQVAAEGEEAAGSKAKSTAAKSKRSEPESSPPAPSEASHVDAPPLLLPGDVLDTLEVFVLNFQELAVRSKALQTKMDERRAARAAGSPLPAPSQHSPVLDVPALRRRMGAMSAPELRHHLHTMGLRMATLTTFIRLLEIKVVELEGEEGTGPLEQDEQLLAQLDAQDAAASSSSSSSGSSQGSGASEAAEDVRRRRLRAAVVYRAGQKRLARAWLVRAKGELTRLLALMREMQGRQEAMDRAAGAGSSAAQA